MNKLSHRRAYRLIHKPSLTTAERQMLSDHLQQCAACRQYAGVAAFLAQNLALKPVRQRPTPRQKAAFKGSVRRTSKRIQIMKPVNAIVGIAIILVFALAGWFLFRSQPETAVTLPHDETIIIATETAVPEPTEPSASVTPEITSIPPTSTLSPTQTTTTSSATQQTYMLAARFGM